MLESVELQLATDNYIYKKVSPAVLIIQSAGTLKETKMHIDPRYSIQSVQPNYVTPKVAQTKVAEMQVQHFVTVINPDLSVSIKNIIDDFYTYDHLNGKIVMKKVICRINSTTFKPVDA